MIMKLAVATSLLGGGVLLSQALVLTVAGLAALLLLLVAFNLGPGGEIYFVRSQGDAGSQLRVGFHRKPFRRVTRRRRRRK
jgi:hypothetical protein